MIGVIFDFIGEIVEVRVNNTNVLFRSAKQLGGAFATIDGLKLDRKGVEKEHPDLKDRDDWKEETIKRFKQKIQNMKTEKERINYIIEDLKKYGYIPLKYQVHGFRVLNYKGAI